VFLSPSLRHCFQRTFFPMGLALKLHRSLLDWSRVCMFVNVYKLAHVSTCALLTSPANHAFCLASVVAQTERQARAPSERHIAQCMPAAACRTVRFTSDPSANASQASSASPPSEPVRSTCVQSNSVYGYQVDSVIHVLVLVARKYLAVSCVL
jgi:hypothetical protein